MQIFVDKCDNNPPDVQTINRLCVVAGTTIDFPVTATDPDSGDFVRLTALGGPLDSTLVSPATFTAPVGFQKPPISGTFHWTTACEHISNQPYFVVFKAVDSQDSSKSKLADLKTVSIKVVGPPPQDVQASAEQNAIEVSWAKPYACENAAENYFYGFSVWRREGSKPFVVDTCTPGLAGKGYTQIVFVTKATKDGRYHFTDTNVERGRTYCYRILGKFARTSSAGHIYNIIESLPSAEACVQLPRDLPLLTKVSVESTDPNIGTIKVMWTKPLASELDTILNHGPYRYQLLRAPGFTGGTFQEIPGASFTSPTFWEANDTMFLDQNLNTTGQPYRYKIDFYVNGNSTPLGTTTAASSVYLTVNSTDQTNLLSWEENVPWENYSYAIFRKNSSGVFELIDSTAEQNYADRGLVNGVQYCYYVLSKGTYSVAGLPSPLLNNSQENCGIPLDTVPPCPPQLVQVNNLCNGQGGDLPDPPYENKLLWTNPNSTCGGSDDVVEYHIWYASSTKDPLALIDQQEEAGNTSYTHLLEFGLTGCYAVSALDSVGNESALSNTICVDNCPEYTLPNAFTPNGDDHNDIFTPFPGWRFVEQVEMQIFNRWGNLVFSTTDPAINWTGRNADGKEMAEGT
ncbi:MAG: gliding motility-associated C-terminal domain-containing protein, partial [Saprospiraceae bacterium]